MRDIRTHCVLIINYINLDEAMTFEIQYTA